MVPLKRICLLILNLLFFLDGGAGLRNLSLWAPRGVVGGARAGVTLRCSYDLEGAALYSARWYRHDQEFYRFVPRELPPTMVFPLPLPGATVDLSASDAQSVRVVGLSRRLSGVFGCEVSADAPLFHTDIRAAPLTVVEPPRGLPELVARSTYARGAPLRAACRVPPAYPQPNITWTLDGKQIAEHISPAPAEGDFSERATSSELELTLADEPSAHERSLSVHALYPHAGFDFLEPRPEQSSGAAGAAGAAGAPLRRVVAAPAAGRAVLRCAARQHDAWSRAAPPLELREDAPRPASVTRGDDGTSSARAARLPAAGLLAALLLHLL